MPGAQPPGRGRGPGHPEIATGLLLGARWVVPVEPAGAVLEHHAVAVRDGAIEAVLPIAEAARRFASYEEVKLPDHVLVPGLVNANTRAALALMRGFPDERRAAAEKRLPARTKSAEGASATGRVGAFSDSRYIVMSP